MACRRHAHNDKLQRWVVERGEDFDRPGKPLARHRAAAIEEIGLADAGFAQSGIERRRLRLEERRIDAVRNNVKLAGELRPEPQDVALRLLADGDQCGGAGKGARQQRVAIKPGTDRFVAIPDHRVMDGDDGRHGLPERRGVLGAMQDIDALPARLHRQRGLLPEAKAKAGAIESGKRRVAVHGQRLMER